MVLSPRYLWVSVSGVGHPKSLVDAVCSMLTHKQRMDLVPARTKTRGWLDQRCVDCTWCGCPGRHLACGISYMYGCSTCHGQNLCLVRKTEDTRTGCGLLLCDFLLCDSGLTSTSTSASLSILPPLTFVLLSYCTLIVFHRVDLSELGICEITSPLLTIALLFNVTKINPRMRPLSVRHSQ